MALDGATGSGATVSFATASVSGCIRSIALNEITMEMVDVTCLSETDFMTKIAAIVKDPGEVQLTAVFDGTCPLPSEVQDTITVTIPAGDGSGTYSTVVISGTGCVTSVGYPTSEIGSAQEISVTFTFDGDTGPTYTPTI